MLLYEVLARDRMRDDQRRARQAQMARRLAAAHRWQRLAHYAERRAVASPSACSFLIWLSRRHGAISELLRTGFPYMAPCRVKGAVQFAKPGCQRWVILRNGTVASSWHSTPNVPVLTRWMSR
jgi:hypothetical protein